MQSVQDTISDARKRHQAGDLQGSAQLCHEVLQVEPANADALYLLGAAFLLQNQFAEAARCFEQVTRLRPNLFEAHHYLANALARMGRHEQALLSFRQAIGLKPDDPDALFGTGLSLSRVGKVPDAAACFRQVVKLKPDHHEAFNHLGISLGKLGKPQEAVAAYQQSIKIKPDYPDPYVNQGIDLSRIGRPDDSIISYRRAIQLRPNHVEAHFNLGLTLSQLNRTDEAIAALREAVRLRPDHVEAYNNLGVAYAKKGMLAEAATSFEEAVKLRPEHAEALNNLGLALAGLDRNEEAVERYKEAVRIRPNYAEAFHNMGMAYRKLNNTEQEKECFQQAITLKPDYAEAHSNLGVALIALSELEKAAVHFSKALRLKPKYVEALNNLSYALMWLGRLEESTANIEEALAIYPENTDLRLNRSILWLLQGKLEEGWREYEWRLFGEATNRPIFMQPKWDGSDLNGRTVLLYPEQGLGDIIQFARYAPLVKAKGGRVLLMCPDLLSGLLKTCPGVDQLVPRSQQLPEFDVQASLLSMPALLGTTEDSIPADVPYLSIEPERLEKWRERLSVYPGFKVGIAWAGNPKHKRDRARSIPLRLFESLAQVKGVRLFSLQVGPGTDQLEEFREKWQIVDLGFKAEPHPEAFLETGAAIKNLDLVISCDTSVVHVAGALAHPVWVAISYVPDWRWLLDGETTKWYPTMRLFRQNRPLEWEPVFKRLAQELEKEVNRPAASGMFGINVGAGELLDRMIILELKAEYLEHAETRNAILGELERLTATRERILRSSPELKALADDLWAANQSLWEIHNNLRGCERKKDFGNRFVELARSLARENDRRSDLKRQINELVGSSFPELKTYRQPEPARKAGAKGS